MMKIKRMLSLVLGTALALSLAACGNTGMPTANSSNSDTLQPPSPFLDCDSIDDAAAIAGFAITLPEEADGFQAWDGYMIQALYGENGDTMLIRKALGSDDISGDYNAYAQIETVDDVTLKGENDQFSLALWTDGEYTYSVHVGNALSQTDMMTLVSGVK